MRRGSVLEAILISLAGFGFILWSKAFIFSSSFISVDGRRMYCLFDDAMISMRYAWNFSHGLGLVWNPGDHIQGYTNLLMTLLMSIATYLFDKVTAVLSIQIFGVILMLLIAFLTMQIADLLIRGIDEPLRVFVRVLAFISALAYYPLANWSLMGMETGLVTVLLLSGLLMAFRYARSGNHSRLIASTCLFGLTFLTRNETAIFFVLAWLYFAAQAKESRDSLKSRWLLVSASLFFLIVIGELVFQYSYYGDVLPNTYFLKLTGMPFLFRIRDGITFVKPFLIETAFILAVAVLDVIIQYNRERLALLLITLLAVAYQIYVGGDAWQGWRLLAPVIPLALILNIDALIFLTHKRLTALQSTGHELRIPKFLSRLIVIVYVTLIMGMGMTLAEFRFLGQMELQVKPDQVQDNEINVDTAIVLTQILRNDATVGVFWAGAIPYYTDYKAVDFLGKSDRYIARLPCDLSGKVSWDGMISVPGHNKYDLKYSILDLEPTYVQGVEWGSQTVSEWAGAKYRTVNYNGVTLRLLGNSPNVLWSKLSEP